MSSYDTVTPTSHLLSTSTSSDTTISGVTNPLAVSSLASRRPLASQPKPLMRPQPLPPRSTLLTSPTRASSFAPSTTSTTRPYSPTTSRPTTRQRSPPVMTMRPSARAAHSSSSSSSQQQPHAQHVLQGPTPEELLTFAALCRRLYYDHDPSAAQDVDSVLQRLPAPSRTAYARTMAGVRSQFHRDEEIRRREEVEAILAASTPNSAVKKSLQVSEGGTGAMRSQRARVERKRLLAAFIKAHCLKGLPGSQPFFKALYAVLHLQSMQESRGGAGKRLVQWEVDVAVFTEAAGGTWTRDSIETLKCVLGFTEHLKEETSTGSYFEDDVSLEAHDNPVSSAASPTASEATDIFESPSLASHKTPPQVPPHRPTTLRSRAISDPFLDPKDRRTPVANGPLTPSSPQLSSSSSPLSTPAEEESSETRQLLPSSSPIASRTTSASSTRLPNSPSTLLHLPAPKPQFRIFTVAPFLTDPELRELCSLFPDYIRTQPSSRPMSSSTPADKVDAETMAGGNGDHRRLSTVGHGEVSIGSTGVREDGFRGSGWERFCAWWKRLFSRR